MKRWKVKIPGDKTFELTSDSPHDDLAAQGYDEYALEELFEVPPAWQTTFSQKPTEKPRYIVAWDDHTGQRHERAFDDWEDAVLETLDLGALDSVEHVYPVVKRQ